MYIYLSLSLYIYIYIYEHTTYKTEQGHRQQLINIPVSAKKHSCGE